MDRPIITFRLDPQKKDELDRLAALMERDRTFVLNEAVAAYLDYHSWQLEQVDMGLQEADAGEFATDEEVQKALSRWQH